MGKSELSLEELEAVFHELGATNPASWACSEVEEGIPQLANFLFLKLARLPIDEMVDINALRTMLRRTGTRESSQALGRLLDAGVPTNDILRVARDLLGSYLTEICFLLDDTSAVRFSGWPRSADLEKVHWGLFRVDDKGNPDSQMAGLHEIVPDFVDSGE